MDSGIYRLTYRTGETYVGKSIHISVRWKQHFDKLQKGKAALNMQDAYKASGHQLPQTEVLLYCHPDMLDYYEGYFINHLKPELNTSIPEVLPEEVQLILVVHANEGVAKYSIIDLIRALHKTLDDLAEVKSTRGTLELEFEALEEDYEELSQAWGSRAVRDAWASSEYRRAREERDEFEAERDYLQIELGELESWRLRVESAGWWSRLWRLW
jgi:hypothetical protein